MGTNDTNTMFDERTLMRAKAILEHSIFINCAEVTAPPAFDAKYVRRIVQSGTTCGFKQMIATTYEDDFKSGCIKLQYYRSFEEEGIVVATRSEDIVQAKRDGKYAIVLGSQFTEIYEDGLHFEEMLHCFYMLGMRIQQLAYQRRSLFADGSGESQNSGLSEIGVEMVKKLDELGVIIELSHVGERSSLEAIELSKNPVLVSHSNAKAICPHIRNKSDDVIKALASKGGVIGINAVSPYLNPNGKQATIHDWLEHVEYISELVGIDHIAIGLDIAGHFGPNEFARQNREFPSFGGAKYSFGQWHVEELYEVEQWKNVVPALITRGFTDEDIVKILGGNILRLMDEVQRNDEKCDT